MIVVDTTVLVYAVGDDHPLRQPCRRLIELVRDGVVEATTTVEVIQELVHVRARRRPRADAAQVGLDFSTLLSPLLRPEAAHLELGLDLFRQKKQLGAFDAVLAATAMAVSASALVSADRSFASVPGLHHLDPAATQFERSLLAAAGSR